MPRALKVASAPLPVSRAGELPLTAETWSTPTVLGAPGQALVVGTDRGGGVSVYQGKDRTLLWQRQLGGEITSSALPAPGAGSARDFWIGTHAGEFLRLEAATGRILQKLDFDGAIRAVPASADLDGDGKPELVVAAYEPSVSAFDADGKRIWKRRLPKHLFVGGTKRGIVSAPLICDVDRDGVAEVVVGIRSARLFCLDARDGRIKWFTRLRYDPDSSPSFVLCDGVPTVIFGGGEHTAGAGDNALIALDGRTGRRLWTAPAGGGIDSAATIVSLPGSGRLVAFACSLASGACLAVDIKTGAELWRHHFGPTAACHHDGRGQCRRSADTPYFTEHAICRSYTTPAVADLDGDGRLEVVVGSNNGSLDILDAETGALRRHEDTGGMVRGSPVLADVDGDGLLELVVPSGSRLLLYRTACREGAWPMFKGRPDHLGAQIEPPPAAQTGGQSPSPWLPLRLFWNFTVLDGLRWGLCKIDDRITRKLGLRLFEYHY